ncbi:MAG TPA: MFS transporter [Tepidiformaceae bacterium]|nr:MFS transporter [Tepidiformaceae bacterium]
MTNGARLERNLRLLYAYWFLREFQLWIPVWIVFLTIERGFSLTAVTIAEGLFLVGVVALEVPTGAVADRWGRSISMALGAFFLGVSVLIFAFTTSFAVLLASFMLWSVAHTLMSGADMALLFDTLKLAGREHEDEGIAGRGAALNWSGVGVATLLGGPVAALFDIRFTIFLGAATSVVAALVALALREPPHQRGERPAEPYLRSIRLAFEEVSATAGLRTVILLGGVTTAALGAVHYLVQPFLVDREIEVGVAFSMLQVPLFAAGMAGSLVAGRVASQAGTRRALFGVPLAGAAGCLAIAFAPGLGAYAPLLVVMFLGSMVHPIATGYVNRRVGSERRATVLSMQGMVYSLVMAVMAPAMGFSTDRWGLGVAFSVCAGLALAALAVFGRPLARAREAMDGAVVAPVAGEA